MSALPVTIKHLGRTDLQLFMDLINLFDEVFAMQRFTMPDTAYLQNVLNDERYIVFVALLDGQVVGGFTAHALPLCYLPTSYVYLQDLAVKVEHQRRGIGRKLIAAAVEYCEAKGYQELNLQADVADDYALEFYRATGGVQEDVVHFGWVTGPAPAGSY